MANAVAVPYPMFLSAFRQVYCHEIYHHLRNHRQVVPPLSSRRRPRQQHSQATILCPTSRDEQTAEDTVLAKTSINAMTNGKLYYALGWSTSIPPPAPPSPSTALMA